MIRLLNRTEYANVIRDLLALEIDRTLLPADGLAYGFDNNAGLLRITPGLLERYMSAARKISRLAIGDPEARPVTELYEQHKYYEPEYGGAEGLPFATRGGLVVKHHFPLDGHGGRRQQVARRQPLPVPSGRAAWTVPTPNLSLIRFGGHLPKGEYDVDHDGDEGQADAAELHG